MPNTPTPRATTKSEASRKFVKSVKQILPVPKEELARWEANYQQERTIKKASRKSKLSALLVLFLWCLSIHSVFASAEERAQILKARVLQRLVQDGWQLVQESQSLLIVERRMTGWGAPVVQALTTGANGTPPVFRWSVTIIPVSEHYTTYQIAGTINSQNAFGQVTSIPGKNKKDAEYMNSVLAWASAGMPKKYTFIKP